MSQLGTSHPHGAGGGREQGAAPRPALRLDHRQLCGPVYSCLSCPAGLYGGRGLLLEKQVWVLWCLQAAVPVPQSPLTAPAGSPLAGTAAGGTFPRVMENKVLMSFAFYSTILILKMYVVAIITGQVRLRKKVSSTFPFSSFLEFSFGFCGSPFFFFFFCSFFSFYKGRQSFPEAS